MPFVFEQPNLDNPSESHLYFDPGDGRLITVFTNEERTADPERTPTDPGCVHHIAFALSQATFKQAVERLDERGIEHSGVKDRGFMDSIYFEDPLGLLIELASYRFEPPAGHTHAEVLLEAHRIRVARGDYNIAPVHLADAIERLVERSSGSLSEDRTPQDPYRSGNAERRLSDLARSSSRRGRAGQVGLCRPRTVQAGVIARTSKSRLTAPISSGSAVRLTFSEKPSGASTSRKKSSKWLATIDPRFEQRQDPLPVVAGEAPPGDPRQEEVDAAARDELVDQVGAALVVEGRAGDTDPDP